MSAKPVPIRTIAEPQFLSPEQVCQLLPGMTPTILEDRRKKRLDPPYFKPTGDRGGVTLYAHEDIVAWVERSRVATRSEVA